MANSSHTTHLIGINMLTQELTQKLLKTHTHYDQTTGIMTWIKPFKGRVVGEIATKLSSNGYLVVYLFGETHRAHRLAWLYVYGEFPENQIDHINGNRLDNRICNLRDVTSSGNAQNQRLPSKNNTSGYLGVSMNGKSYIAQITVNGKGVLIGRYKYAKNASKAYINAKRKLHQTCTI